jgi:hypothetical protein
MGSTSEREGKNVEFTMSREELIDGGPVTIAVIYMIKALVYADGDDLDNWPVEIQSIHRVDPFSLKARLVTSVDFSENEEQRLRDRARWEWRGWP